MKKLLSLLLCALMMGRASAASLPSPETLITLSDDQILVDGAPITGNRDARVYLSYQTEVHPDVPPQLQGLENRVITITDNGAYRITGSAQDAQIAVKAGEDDEVRIILDNADITVRYAEDGSQHVYIADEDVTHLLRTPELGMGASNVGLHPPVRQKLAALQRQVGVDYDVVMDGREITTFVLPHTKHKFYLTASVEERARRRLGELRERGDNETTLEYIAAEIEKRDKNDMSREYMPLRIAEDATVIDTTEMSIEEVLDVMLGYIREKQEA